MIKIGGRVKETEQKFKKSNYPILLAPPNLIHFKKWRQIKNSQLSWSYLTGSNLIRLNVLEIGAEVVKNDCERKETGFFITFCLSSKSGARSGEILKGHLGLFEVAARLQNYSHSPQQHRIRGQGYSNQQKTI